MIPLLADGMSNGGQCKKPRVEDASAPSCVLLISQLPNEASETEVMALGLPFGSVTNILTLKGRNQVRHWDKELSKIRFRYCLVS